MDTQVRLFIVFYLIPLSQNQPPVTQTQCYKSYSSCIECVQDPCSRKKSNFIREENCFWCSDLNHFPDPNKSSQGCLPNGYDNLCGTSSISVSTNQCPEPSKLKHNEGGNGCGYLANDHLGFAVDLTFDEDITVAGQPSDEVSFETWVHLCNSVRDTSFASTCKQLSPIGMIERVNSQSYRNAFCWNFGLNAVFPYLALLVDDPVSIESGFYLDYGQGYCCPNNGTGIGQAKRIDIKLFIKPNCGEGAQWELEPIDYDHLTNCSASDKSELVISLLSPAACKENIIWRLSANETKISCQWSDGGIVDCSILPVVDVSHAMATCKEFTLLEKLSNGSVKSSPIKSCNFSVSSRANLCSFSVVYTFPTSSPVAIMINGDEDFQVSCDLGITSHHPTASVLAVAVGFLCLFLLILIGTVMLRKKSRNHRYWFFSDRDIETERLIERSELGDISKRITSATFL